MSEYGENKGQNITINNMNEIIMSGILSVDSFDEFRICVTCLNGAVITVDGTELCVKQVNPDSGTVEASGQIKGLYCEDNTSTSKSGFLKSLLFKR